MPIKFGGILWEPCSQVYSLADGWYYVAGNYPGGDAVFPYKEYHKMHSGQKVLPVKPVGLISEEER